MTPESLLEKLAKINVWKRGGQRAPHKPLLLLLSLAKARRGESRLQPYETVEREMTELLQRFGPPRQQHQPIHPFLRLTNDGLWEIPRAAQLPRTESGAMKDSSRMRPSELRRLNIEGGLPEDIYDALRNDDGLLRQAMRLLLNNEFPQSYHGELLEAVAFGDIDAPDTALDVADAALDPAFDTVNVRRRDPEFRHRVIMAYEHRCAICNYDIRISNQLLGLEAAHILWHSKGGPDEVPNGLALCTLHHNALDRGGISVEDDMTLLVSPELHGHEAAQIWFLEYAGKQLRTPRENQDRPDPEYLDWHRREVFRSAARRPSS